MLLSLAKGKPACDSAVFFWSKIIPDESNYDSSVARLSSIQLLTRFLMGILLHS
jgi:hypothetical protein